MHAGVYLHIPFCKSRCSYCDFATDVWRSDEVVDRYVNALRSEILSESPPSGGGQSGKSPNWPAAHAAGFDTDTVYFGGGTPSLLKPEQIERILDAIKLRFEISESAEVTMEMNPATVSTESLAAYRSLGVNRASFGVQSFNDRHLKLLSRGHDANDARQTFKMLREAGFENISFDLIAGLPGQSLADWKRNLNEAVAMQPEHLSLYLLEVHEGTPLAEQVRSGRRPVPDEDLAAEMYEVMIGELAKSGYEQYEISNFAKPGFESRHNSKYWRLDPVYGFGVSAHSFDGFERYSNERDTTKYVSMVERGGYAEVMREAVDRSSEYVFLGLRLNRGIDLKTFCSKFGVRFDDRFPSVIDELKREELVFIDGDALRLTRKGMLFSNEVFQAFV